MSCCASAAIQRQLFREEYLQCVLYYSFFGEQCSMMLTEHTVFLQNNHSRCLVM